MALASPYSTAAPTFNPLEIIAALAIAGFVQGAFFGLLIAAGKNELRIKQQLEPVPSEVPMAVKPIMDDAPLLKLGGKKVKPKLPDMWKKQEPLPVERFEESSAPSEKAVDKPEAAPTSTVAKGDAEAPPPDAEIAKSVDEQVHGDAAPPPTASGEGAADGVKEGTETDPLKARAVSLYRAKIIGWFNSKFHVPVGQIPCDELKKLSSRVSASVSPDGTVTGFSVNGASGNSVFDGRVSAAMQSAVGQQVPPPPPMYKDVLPPNISLNFLGSSQKCE
jgi:outer membrane biosynthesis protein TonB